MGPTWELLCSHRSVDFNCRWDLLLNLGPLPELFRRRMRFARCVRKLKNLTAEIQVELELACSLVEDDSDYDL